MRFWFTTVIQHSFPVSAPANTNACYHNPETKVKLKILRTKSLVLAILNAHTLYLENLAGIEPLKWVDFNLAVAVS